MDVREMVRTSEFWALVSIAILHTLAFYTVIDPVASQGWEVALATYAGGRFVSKMAKASVPPSNGGSK